jgi:hypothetical protein
LSQVTGNKSYPIQHQKQTLGLQSISSILTRLQVLKCSPLETTHHKCHTGDYPNQPAQ